jgi:hypothetical protein
MNSHEREDRWKGLRELLVREMMAAMPGRDIALQRTNINLSIFHESPSLVNDHQRVWRIVLVCGDN